MISVFIGHRGVGKTSLLKRLHQYLSNYGQQALCIDLDEWIQGYKKQSIQEIFNEQGEAAFRLLEVEAFKIVMADLRTIGGGVIAVGAGFPVEEIPFDIRVIWLQRESDSWGRIFLNRPRLEPELTPLREFELRREKRESKFIKVAWETYLLPEGLNDPHIIEKAILTNEINDLGGVLTLLPENFSSADVFKNFIRKRIKWNVDYFEVRDDLLSDEHISLAKLTLPAGKILFSRRRPRSAGSGFEPIEYDLIDWGLELGAPDINLYDIVSLHHRETQEPLSEVFKKFKPYIEKGKHLKLAVPIHNFDELFTGFQWQQEDPLRRSFLPRSSDGRWHWFRLLMKGRMRLNFFREGRGSAADQPSLFQWLSGRQGSQRFAAVIGSPVRHSYTPIEQYDFFKNRDASVYSIDCSDAEWDIAFPYLKKMGLVAAAITSPLKNLAFDSCDQATAQATKFKSINTLVLDSRSKDWIGENTDFSGLKELLRSLGLSQINKSNSDIVVWGGGGTLTPIREIVPYAIFYSSQTGLPRDGMEPASSPDTVIWAAPRKETGDYFVPPKSWRPKVIFDLNYREDSPGREYAQLVGASYVSGERMFVIQAEGQRNFWEEYL